MAWPGRRLYERSGCADRAPKQSSTRGARSRTSSSRTRPGDSARKRMGAGVLLSDLDGRMLLVEPTYKPYWEIPGGSVEADESPYAAVVRELKEELGLPVQLGRLLVTDWVPPRPDRTEGLMVVYDGGIVTPEQIAQMRLPADELRSWAWCTERRRASGCRSCWPGASARPSEPARMTPASIWRTGSSSSDGASRAPRAMAGGARFWSLVRPRSPGQAPRQLRWLWRPDCSRRSRRRQLFLRDGGVVVAFGARVSVAMWIVGLDAADVFEQSCRAEFVE